MEKTACIIIGTGIGNQLMATPMIKAMHWLGYKIDLHIYGTEHNLFSRWPLNNIIFNTAIPEILYDVAVKTHGVKGKVFPKASNYYTTTGYFQDKKHEVDSNMAVAHALGYKGATPDYYTDSVDYGTVQADVVIHAGCDKSWGLKIYPHFKKLAELLVAENITVAVIGGKTDNRDLWDSVFVLNYVGQLTLLETAQVIKNAGFFISGDSGMMHLASGFKKRGLVLFGCSSPKKNKPYFGDIVLMRLTYSCVPCYEKRKHIIKKFSECKYNKKCLRDIPPEGIMEVMKNA